MIKIFISNNLTATNCTPKVISVCKKALTISNPAYQKIVRITGSRWGVQAFFKYFRWNKKTPDTIVIPRGFASRFLTYLDNNKIEYEVSYDFVKSKIMDYNMEKWKPIKLRDYQEPIIKDITAIGNDCGVINASTGSGKTVLACEMVRRMKYKTTILVPTTVIQGQFRAEFKKWFDYDVGIINGDKKEIKDVTVAMWQSLAGNDELTSQLAERTGMLIVDECHGVISKMRLKTLEKFKPTKLYGMSGSPRRSRDDGRTDAIFFFMGPEIHKYEMTQLKPTVQVIRTGTNIAVSDNYAEMIDNMIEDEGRNTLLHGLIMGEILDGRKILVLLKRREHCKIITEKLGNCGVYYADSDDQDRNQTLNRMRDGDYDFNVLIGTVNILATGTDIPSLDTVILGGDIKSNILVEQGAGRILRLFDSKADARIIDLHDNKNGILNRQFYERKRFYDRKGWEII